jgi:predicted CXXCH cytochrome family protein
LVDEDVGLPDVEQLELQEDGGRNGRSRWVLAGVLLLLLLLCTVTTVVDVWVTAPTASQQQAILRNIECLRCHVEMMPLFTKESVHNPFAKKQCTTCHSPHGEIVRTTKTFGPVERWQRLRTLIEWLPLRLACEIGKSPVELLGQAAGVKSQTTEKQVKGKDSKTTLPSDELCWMCHGNIGPQRAMDYTHNPFMKGRCTSCHDPHASDFGPLLTQSERDLCVTCHPIGLQLNRAQTHPPVANRYCTTCHHPHASNYRGILVSNQRDLCFTCHPTVAPLSLKAVQHKPFIDDCTGCHEPHGSNYVPLLRQEQPPLCYKCHPTIRYDFLKASHHPADSSLLDCAGCHDPHASDYAALLTAKDNAICYKCHTAKIGNASAIKVSYEGSAHKGTLCISCHTPHGSAYGPLLREPNPALCYRCHPSTRNIDEAFPANHPHRPDLYWDVVALKPMTCTTTCHNPHGSRYDAMVRIPYGGDGFGRDNLCLACHPRVGIDF